MHQESNSATPLQEIFDVLILNGEVFDGSGSPSVKQDIAIKGDKIVKIGDLNTLSAIEVIDAQGLVVSPGFIDVHTHDDLEVLRNPVMMNKISQGVTSVIIGNCGISASPYVANATPVDPINLLGQKDEFAYPELNDFIEAFNNIRPNLNVAALVGHISLRAQVMKDLDKGASESEIKQMVDLLNLALSQGAKGLSTGLAYHNANAAPTSEVQALVSTLAPYNAIYTTHLRTEFDGIIGALDEAFSLGKQGKVPVIVSHLKCAGKNNWGRSSEVLQHISQARENQAISCDCYPYNASSSTLDLSQVTDDFEIFITWSETHPEKSGQLLANIAAQWQVSLIEAARKLQPAGAVYHCMLEDDVRQIMQAPYSMIGSDGLPCDPHPHPRLWGTFPRVLGHYSRDHQTLALAQAIHKMTGLSATEFKLKQRGFIREGYFADIVLFNANTIKDQASFTEPFLVSEGIEKVWVNGQLTYYANEILKNSKGAGRFLAHEN
ncbi:N-acyl-D-amino-acid deacylase family protein [Thalassotalea profundi]|uniref:D-aminoacylase n=1 Tax=Thalassotalea profundi TaxID=2036687 RepID=A0ABQ3J2F7_9GAMM|nr:D-aminoacylase [Thalassotalea profundi]GHE99001.1 D-aminoacylase [Thalassotalea profundi]